MIVAIIVLFAVFVFLEIVGEGRAFGLGANPIVLFIFHLLRLGSLSVAMALTFFYSQLLFWVLLTLLLVMLCMSLVIGNERRKIKKIIRIYIALKGASTDTAEAPLLHATATKYYQSLSWDSERIGATIKTLFANTESSPKDIMTLAAWLLVFEKPQVMNRFAKRYAIASRLLMNQS
jgi:hypothetical protein